MAKYKSRFTSLGFYVDGGRRRFKDGKYTTDNEAEIKVLDGIAEVVRVDEPKPTEENEEVAEVNTEDKSDKDSEQVAEVVAEESEKVTEEAPKPSAFNPKGKAKSNGKK